VHPARSVILFTTASGAGYGLLAWLGVLAALGLLPAERWLGLAAFVLGFGLVVVGLVSSTFHLGHPERAWRALSQWRSSWLSREGVAALFTFLPAAIFALYWIFAGTNSGVAAAVGLLTAVSCLVTVACTAMIYASLKTIRAWTSPWTLPAYLVLSAASGAVLLNLLAQLWALPPRGAIGWLVIALLVLAVVVKLLYWRDIAAHPGASSAASATGLGDFGRVGLLEAPHSESNYLMQEMGFRVARKHASKLRRLSLLAGFLAPLLLLLAAQLAPGIVSVAAAVLTVPLLAVGLALERWLFFAEAKHVVTLYYGNDRC
jgi:sulfite dehydrogenase (quinone) subunit SoeC